jgi:peptidoglycan L-alanyl-D-glutamate endopeptidase CwlK
VASEEGVNVRWGGDWDGDRDIDDQTFDDLPHFEFRL